MSDKPETVGVSKYSHLSAGYCLYTEKANLGNHNKTIWAIQTKYFWLDIHQLSTNPSGLGKCCCGDAYL